MAALRHARAWLLLPCAAHAAWVEECKAGLMAGMPPHYVAHRVSDAEIAIDGRLEEPAWRLAPSVTDFGSIYGREFQARHPEERPWHGTRAQVLWSESFVYVAGHLEESQLFATEHGWRLPTEQVSSAHPRFDCTESWIPSCPYRNADFEFFLSPGLHGSPEWYKEFEFNANTDTRWNEGQGPSIMTLALPRPYNDLHGLIPLWLNPSVCSELQGCEMKVTSEGRINDPVWAAAHPNSSWTVEAKIPVEYLLANVTGAQRPTDGVQWRMAFSRVEYHLQANASQPGGYEKVFTTDMERKQGHLDRNWVWPPTYMYDVHMPDLWSILQFSAEAPGRGPVPFREADVHWPAYGTLSRLYYAQWAMQMKKGAYSTDLEELRDMYSILSDPQAADAWKEAHEVLAFPAVPSSAWDPGCVEIWVEADQETGWRAAVTSLEEPDQLWTMDGWRRVRLQSRREELVL